MRGEHFVWRTREPALAETSPHARGTHHTDPNSRANKRNIPACAGNTMLPSGWLLFQPKHPRMRGEHPSSSGAGYMDHRTSPHARGTPPAGPHRSIRNGNIPACAGNTTFLPIRLSSCEKHPRMRGEHGTMPLLMHQDSETSPHARGTRMICWIRESASRNIPACAGNTPSSSSLLQSPRKHPRMRGEHCMASWPVRPTTETSPHARGTQPRASHVHNLTRNIPACAGNTLQAMFRATWTKKHPRMRGEHPSPIRRPTAILETSPHARGTPIPLVKETSQRRNIPACAGNTFDNSVPVRAHQKHPRMRGEHRKLDNLKRSTPETSPHARGTQTWSLQTHEDDGNIPACAGNTSGIAIIESGGKKHPRMRGEHLLLLRRRLTGRETSPHARGTLSVRRIALRLVGNIPACAGNTFRRALWLLLPRKHPRMRGEHSRRSRAIRSSGETSPHARGTPPESRIEQSLYRNIPACAGNTSYCHDDSQCGRKHPRMRGEHSTCWLRAEVQLETSPHARGTPVVFLM